MSDESYVKPAWCGTDYIAKVRGREGGREGERGEERERGEGKKFIITERMSAQFGLVSAVQQWLYGRRRLAALQRYMLCHC